MVDDIFIITNLIQYPVQYPQFTMQFVGLNYRIGFIYCIYNYIHFRFNKSANIDIGILHIF
jgi:hypothetical protein